MEQNNNIESIVDINPSIIDNRTQYKDTKSLRFLHLAFHIHENLFRSPIMISGFYNWHRAFEGEFSLYPGRKGRLSEYDILFVGISRPELDGVLLSQMRQEIGWETNTKIIVCIDYAIELWQGTFNPFNLEQELMQADMIFISEPTMIQHVRSLIGDRKPVHHIMHPSCIEQLHNMRKPYELRTDTIAAIIHRYDNNWLDPWLAIKNLPWDTTAVLLDPSIQIHLYAYYKFMKEGIDYMPFLDWLARQKVILDSYHRLHTYGRTAVDAACIGVPIVGTNWIHAQQLLWPDLTVECGDTIGQEKIIRQLMTDKEFYDNCVEQAWDKVQEFSYANKKIELLNKLYN